MTEKKEAWNNDSSGESGAALRQGIDSRFRLIVVAALRSKQLQRGSRPRIEADPSKRRSISIALEEVRQGLVPFVIMEPEQKDDRGHHSPAEGEEESRRQVA